VRSTCQFFSFSSPSRAALSLSSPTTVNSRTPHPQPRALPRAAHPPPVSTPARCPVPRLASARRNRSSEGKRRISPARGGRRWSPHTRRRSPGLGAEVVGSGRSLRARWQPGQGGAHASSSTPATPVNPYFFLLPQLRQAPTSRLVLLSGPCSTRPTEDCPCPLFFEG
jgi:hypothetical protein